MNPPIPEPMAAPPMREKGPRPEALKYFMAVALFLSVVGIIYCDGTMTEYSVAADFTSYFILTALWLALLWLLWQGRNWARIVVMISCPLALLGLFMMSEYSLLQQIVTLTETAFSLVFFWWLRTPAVVAFTKGKPSEDQIVSA